MEVKRNPNTSPNAGPLGYQRGQGVDFSPLAQGIQRLGGSFEELAKKHEEEDKARQAFDINKMVLEEKRRMQVDFQARQTSQDSGAGDFADRLDQDNLSTHESLLNSFYDQGYDEEILMRGASQLGELRNGFFANGLAHQAGQLRAAALRDTDQVITIGSQEVAANPESFAETKEFVRQTIQQNPDLTEAERIKMLDNADKTLIGVGMQATARTNPDYVLRLLDPTGKWQREQRGGIAGSDVNLRSGPGSTVFDFIVGKEGFKTNAYWDVDHWRVGYGSDTITKADGTVVEVTKDTVITKADADRDLLRRANKLDEDIADFAPDGWGRLHGNAKTAVMSVAYNYGLSHSRLKPLWSAIQTGDPDRVASIIESFANDNAGVNRQRRLDEAALVRTVDVPQSTAEQTAPLDVPEQEQELTERVNARTGDPLFDAADGASRIQALGWALESKNQRKGEDRAAMDVIIGNITAEAFDRGEIASRIPTEQEVLDTYGPIAGPQKWSGLNQAIQAGGAIQKFRTASDSSIAAQLEQLRPKEGSPTYATDLQAYEAAAKAADSLRAAREDDPAAYVLKYFPNVSASAEKGTAAYYASLDRAYLQLGIDPKTAPPLPAASVKKMADEYDRLTSADRYRFFTENYQTMGEDRFGNFIYSLKDTNAFTDAVLYEAIRKWPNSTVVLPNIFAGLDIIRKDPARAPNYKEANAAFMTGINSAITSLDPTFSKAARNGAAALYAFSVADPTQFDEELYEKSLATVLGGNLPVDMTAGRVKEFTILPAGVSEAKFNNWFESRTLADLAKKATSGQAPFWGNMKTRPTMQHIIDEGVPILIAPNVYGIKMGSDGRWLVGSDGRPWTMNLRPSDVVTGRTTAAPASRTNANRPPRRAFEPTAPARPRSR